MSKLGRSISQVNKSSKRNVNYVNDSNINKRPIGIKTPLEKGSVSGETLFKMHFDLVEQVKDNLRNLIQTTKGERLGFPDFGTDLQQIFSDRSLTDEQIFEIAMNEIKDAVDKYMPTLSLVNFKTGEIEKDSGTTSLSGNGVITRINKGTFSEARIYKIDLDFTIPIVNNIQQQITLFINAAR